MGRGLSEMQKLILERAVEQQWVCGVDICEFYFNWPPCAPYFAGELRNALPRYSKRMPKNMVANACDQYRAGHPLDNTLIEKVLPGVRGRPIFSKERIGVRKYHSACSSISRAFRRLRERGLLEQAFLPHYESALQLQITEKGFAVAKYYGLRAAKKMKWKELQAKRAAWKAQEQKADKAYWSKLPVRSSPIISRLEKMMAT